MSVSPSRGHRRRTAGPDDGPGRGRPRRADPAARRGPRRVRRPGRAGLHRRRLPRPRRPALGQPRAARWSPSTTSTCPPSTCTTLAAEGHACRPGPDALVHAQDKAVMRARLAALGVPGPRHRVVADPQRGGATSRPRSAGSRWCSRPPAAATTARASGWCRRPRTARDAFAAAAASGVADPGRGAGRLPPRAVRAGGPLPVGPGRGVPGRRVRPARRRLLRGDRPCPGPRPRARGRRRSGSPCGSPASST